MKSSDIITTDLRNSLDDASATQWPDDVLRGYIKDGVELTRTQHPEARLKADGAMEPIEQEALASNGQEFALDMIYRVPLQHYVAYRAFSSEAADQGDLDQAKLHLDTYNEFFGRR